MPSRSAVTLSSTNGFSDGMEETVSGVGGGGGGNDTSTKSRSANKSRFDSEVGDNTGESSHSFSVNTKGGGCVEICVLLLVVVAEEVFGFSYSKGWSKRSPSAAMMDMQEVCINENSKRNGCMIYDCRVLSCQMMGVYILAE